MRTSFDPSESHHLNTVQATSARRSGHIAPSLVGKSIGPTIATCSTCALRSLPLVHYFSGSTPANVALDATPGSHVTFRLLLADVTDRATRRRIATPLAVAGVERLRATESDRPHLRDEASGKTHDTQYKLR